MLLEDTKRPGRAQPWAWLGKQDGVGSDCVFTGNKSVEVFAFMTQTLVRLGNRADEGIRRRALLVVPGSSSSK